MSKPRILLEDVARAAGVSKSTVDRVVNARPGVRRETVDKVQAALEKLGYSASALARHLPEGTRRIALFLPDNDNLFFHALGQALGQRIAHLGLPAQLHRLPLYDPAHLGTALTTLPPEIDAVITVAIDAPEVREAVDRLEARGTRVITLVSDVPGARRSAYVGLDNFTAGRTAGALMSRLIHAKAGSVAVLIGHLSLRDHLDRRSGFEQVLAERRPELGLIPAGVCKDDAALARTLTARILAQHPDLLGLYVVGDGNAGVLQALLETGRQGLCIIAHEHTDITRAALLDGRYHALIAQDVEEITRRALEAALSPQPAEAGALPIGVLIKENLPPAHF